MALTIVGCAGSPDTAAPADGPWQVERFEWQGPVSQPASVWIVNHYGDVRVRTTQRGVLRVTAQVQTFGDERFTIDIDDDTGTIAVSSSATHPQGRVDMTVLLPPGKRLRLETIDGLAEAKYRGDIDVQSRHGAIFVATPLHVQARSETGHIGLALGIERPSAAIEAVTSGNIDAWFVPAANLQIDARGSVVQVDKMGAAKSTHADAEQRVVVLGAGTGQVTLSSHGGHVRIRELPPG